MESAPQKKPNQSVSHIDGKVITLKRKDATEPEPPPRSPAANRSDRSGIRHFHNNPTVRQVIVRRFEDHEASIWSLHRENHIPVRAVEDVLRTEMRMRRAMAA